MINIIINDHDNFYRKGMELFLTQFFHSNFLRKVSFDHVLKSENIATADIIIKHIIPGEAGICQPLFRVRKQGGLIIGVHQGNTKSPYGVAHHCFSGIVHISRSDSLDKIEKAIHYHWRNGRHDNILPKRDICHGCRVIQLSAKQKEVAFQIYSGITAFEGALNLGLSHKTINTHKRRIMMKFNLSNDRELVNFLNLYHKHSLVEDYSR